MKTPNFHLTISLLIFCCFLLQTAYVTFAQTAQVIESPSLLPKISTTSSAQKQDSLCDKQSSETVYISPKKIDDFVKELNKLGTCGYRLVKAAKIPLATESGVRDLFVFGVIVLDAGQKYEYNWFAAASPGEVVTRANHQAENGFYFRSKMMFISGRCSDSAAKQKKDNESSGALGDLANLSLGSSGSVFIFERKNGIIKKNEYRVLDGAVERGEKALAQNQKIMDDYIARGFRPVEIFYLGIFDLFTVVMEKDSEVKPSGEYRLLRETYAINKKFEQLSQEGFTPEFVGFYFAIMHRQNKETINVSYDSADSQSEITKKLLKWQKQGAAYQATGIADYDVGCDPYEGKLFFSIPKSSKNSIAKVTDYKVLEMSNFVERFLKKKDKNASFADLPPPGKLQEFYRLLEQGYVIRDLFWQYEVLILFERPNK